MEALPYRGLPGHDVVCPFLRQYTIGKRDSVCRSARDPVTVSPAYAISCCRTKHHCACRRYIMARGSAEAEALAIQTNRVSAMVAPQPAAQPAATRRTQRPGRLMLAAALLWSLALLLALTVLQPSLPFPRAGAGPQPPARSNAAHLGDAPPSRDLPATPPPTLGLPTPTLATGLGAAVVETGPEASSILLYREPVRSGFVLRTIKPGERLTLLEGPHAADGETWWKVEYVGRSGWVTASAIKRLP